MALPKNQHNANAVAVDIGAVCEIPAAKLHVLAGHNAEVATTMFKWCATELGRMQRFAQSIATRSATARMAGFLLDISDYYGARGFSPVRFTLPMARTDIGRHLGLAAETVSRTINRLRADAIADVHR
jgi:CRP/FNR family transcriptional regulator, anaerobic regulatory protein